MERREDEVCGEGTADRNLDFKVVVPFEFFGVVDMLVDGLEPALDVLVLSLVEGLDVAGFRGGFIGGDGAEAVAFSRGVSTDEI